MMQNKLGFFFGGLLLLVAIYVIFRLRRDPFRRTAIPWQSVAEFAVLFAAALTLQSAGWIPDVGPAALIVLAVVCRSLICLLAGALLGAMGLWTPAAAVYRLGLLLWPARLFRVLLLVNRGALFLSQGRHDEAIAALAAALDLAPEQLQPLSGCNARIYLGLAYLGRGDYEPARQSFQAALLLDPPGRDYKVPILLNLALVHLQAGQPDAAIEMLDRVLAADHWPAHGNIAHLNRGIAQAMRGDFPRAEAELRQALEGDLSADHGVAAHLNLGETYLLQGRLDAAAGELETVFALEPDEQRRAYAWGLWGLIEAERGRVTQALRTLDEALTLDTVDRALIRAYRGWTIHRAGRTDEARAEMQQALADAASQSPATQARIHYLCGLVDQAAGQLEPARTQFEAAATVAPLTYHARLAREALAAIQKQGWNAPRMPALASGGDS